MDFDEFSDDVMRNIDHIINHVTYKSSLQALKNYQETLKEVEFAESDISEIIKTLATALFFYHFMAIKGDKK